MATIDTKLIDGYDEMSPEDKIKALEGFDVPDPDYSGYVSKDVFDKTASELAEKKKALKAKMTEDEQKQQHDEEERAEMQEKYEKLLRKTTVSENTAKLIGLGYDEKLAIETAEAMVDGDTEKVFENQQKHLAAYEKKIRADILKNTPKPDGKGGGDDVMTLEKYKALSLSEQIQFHDEHPEEYEELYGGK